MTQEPQARLFFALWPDQATRAALFRHAQALRGSAAGRLTRPSKLHMTVVFLGDVERSRIPQLAAIAANCAAGRFDMTIDTSGYWPRQKIVWAAPQNVPAALAALVAGMQSALRHGGFRVEDRAWRAHVTLLRDAAAPVEAPPLALRWAVREFVLVESLRGEYRVINRRALAIT